MDFNLTQEQLQIRDEIRKVCRDFPDTYWREIDHKKDYPEAFVRQLSELGWLAALIPEDYGGTGLGITEASIILEEINRSGGVATACHAQMYTMGTLLRHGNEEQKRRYLPKIASGELRLQAFGVTEPNAGSESTRIETTATRQGDRYLIHGQKIFISRVLQSDLMLLLTRTTPYDELKDKTKGLSVFIVDLREAKGKLEVKALDLMINHHTNALFFDGVEVPVENLIGEEGMGFRYIIDGWNAERILVAAEAIGDGRWFVERAAKYASERVIFGRAIGSNQGIQFPIAKAYANVEAADLVRYQAATKFDRKEKCGAEANMAKLLASEAAWEAANACLTTHGGYGFATEYDVERKFRETRLLTVAPVSNNLVLAYLGQHVLGMPKSY
ncbi:MAG TPA: acyl-CoA dehydrogenase family protein [Candidatus Binatia bacterium]|nr:acyl-CoA dehydrogenase family protein [Candidatus Binatia bacterium]